MRRKSSRSPLGKHRAFTCDVFCARRRDLESQLRPNGRTNGRSSCEQSHDELVPKPVHRENMLRLLRLLLDLPAELHDEVVDRAIRGVGFEAPDFVEELV